MKRAFRTPATEVPASLAISAAAGTISAAAAKRTVPATAAGGRESDLSRLVIPVCSGTTGSFANTVAVGGGRGRFGIGRPGSPLRFPDSGAKPILPGF